jgi:hypothetical protein
MSLRFILDSVQGTLMQTQSQGERRLQKTPPRKKSENDLRFAGRSWS